MSSSTTIQLSVLFTLLSVHLAQATSGPDLVEPLDSLFKSLPHTAFEWVEAKGVSDRAAMRVPVNLDGTRGWFQLDTGLDVTLLYGDNPAERGWEVHDGMRHVLNFEIGGIHLGPTWLHSSTDTGKKGGLIGSLGLDLLVEYFLLIDYPGRRLALMKPGEATPGARKSRPLAHRLEGRWSSVLLASPIPLYFICRSHRSSSNSGHFR